MNIGVPCGALPPVPELVALDTASPPPALAVLPPALALDVAPPPAPPLPVLVVPVPPEPPQPKRASESATGAANRVFRVRDRVREIMRPPRASAPWPAAMGAILDRFDRQNKA
jgi:hypothetical protein